jgi:SNF2 family DNA or RNA helicase
MVGEWRVQDGLLGVTKPDGEFWVPDADLIFGARFGSPGETSLPNLDASEAVSALSFERFPSELQLIVKEASDRTGKLTPLLLLMTRDGTRQISGQRAVIGGHVVVDGRWIPISPHHLDEYKTLVATIGTDLFEGISLKQYLRLRLSASAGGILQLDELPLPATERMPQLLSAETESELERKLYPFQKAGLGWLRWLGAQQVGGVLADEMGLGKTIQLIAFLVDRCREAPTPNLVLGTASILENWRRELSRFAPHIRVIVHQGSARTGSPAALRNADVVVTSYDTLVRDTVLFGQINWNAVIADEAQFLKNPDTLRSTAARVLKKELVIASTGTPIENSLRDLWSLVDITIPGFLGDQSLFLSTFPDEPAAAARLATITAPVVLRRRVAEVATDLPPRIDIPTPLVFSDAEASAYESLRAGLLASGTASFGALTKLRMFCAHPTLSSGENADPAESSIKYSRLVEVLGEIFLRNEKALVFASFKRMIDIIVDDVRQRFGGFVESVDGRTPIPDRQKTIDHFSAVGGAALLVLNPRAAGVGLNISAANHVVHYTLEWNPAVEDQASARAHRRGQTLPVTVHRFFYSDSVEEVMNERIQGKRVLIEKGVVGNKGDGVNMRDLIAALRLSPVRR